MSSQSRAIVLLSGGLDSLVTLHIALDDMELAVWPLTFSYQQRHWAEIQAARRIAARLGLEKRHIVQDLDFQIMGGSSLTDHKIEVPKSSSVAIPNTYVPARNTIFLSYALAWCEILDAGHVFIGANAVDYSGYPDCRPEYFGAFQDLTDVALKKTVEGERVLIHAPLVDMSKADIVCSALDFKANIQYTVSCYKAQPDGTPCHECESCRIRREAFEHVGVKDPGDRSKTYNMGRVVHGVRRSR